MNVDVWSPSTFSVVEGCMESNPVHFAWSRDLYRSAAVTFTVDACLRFLFGAAGSGWPARRRNHFKPLCTGHRPYRGSTKPALSVNTLGIGSQLSKYWNIYWRLIPSLSIGRIYGIFWAVLTGDNAWTSGRPRWVTCAFEQKTDKYPIYETKL